MPGGNHTAAVATFGAMQARKLAGSSRVSASSLVALVLDAGGGPGWGVVTPHVRCSPTRLDHGAAAPLYDVLASVFALLPAGEPGFRLALARRGARRAHLRRRRRGRARARAEGSARRARRRRRARARAAVPRVVAGAPRRVRHRVGARAVRTRSPRSPRARSSSVRAVARPRAHDRDRHCARRATDLPLGLGRRSASSSSHSGSARPAACPAIHPSLSAAIADDPARRDHRRRRLARRSASARSPACRARASSRS